MKRLLSFAIFACCLAAAWAAPYSVAFLDGKVELKQGSAWKAVDIGDSVPETATVRLGKASLLELEGKSGRLLISNPGVFELGSYKPAVRDAKIVEVLRKLTTEDNRGVTVAGVRGAAADAKDDTIWMTGEDDADVDADAAYKNMRNSAWREASKLFGEALAAYKAREAAPEDAVARCAYWAAYCATKVGSEGSALAYLRAGDASKAGELRGQYALLQASLEAAGGSKADARAVLEKGLAGAWFGGDEATARGILAGLK